MNFIFNNNNSRRIPFSVQKAIEMDPLIHFITANVLTLVIMFVLFKIYGEVIHRIKIYKLNKLRDRKTEIEDSIKSDKKEIIKCKNLLVLFENYSIEPIHNGITSYDCKVCIRVLERAINEKNTELENICELLSNPPR